MPLSLLETVVNDWTEQVKNNPPVQSGSPAYRTVQAFLLVLMLNIWTQIL